MQLKHGVQGQTGEGELSSATESSKDTSSWAPRVQTDLWQYILTKPHCYLSQGRKRTKEVMKIVSLHSYLQHESLSRWFSTFIRHSCELVMVATHSLKGKEDLQRKVSAFLCKSLFNTH